MMTPKEQHEFERAKAQIAKFLINVRKEMKFRSPFEAAREAGISFDTIYRFEMKKSIPTPRMTLLLCDIYRLNEAEREEFIALTSRARELRSMGTKARKKAKKTGEV